MQAWFWHAGSEAWQTAVFTTMCFTQLAHVMAIRSEHTSLFALGLASNRPLLGAVLLTLALQLALVYVPLFNTLFHTVPLRPAELATCVAAALLVFMAVEMEKRIRAQRRAGDSGK